MSKSSFIKNTLDPQIFFGKISKARKDNGYIKSVICSMVSCNYDKLHQLPGLNVLSLNNAWLRIIITLVQLHLLSRIFKHFVKNFSMLDLSNELIVSNNITICIQLLLLHITEDRRNLKLNSVFILMRLKNFRLRISSLAYTDAFCCILGKCNKPMK